MQTKKIIGIALAAALVSSMAAVAATSVSAADAKFTTLGVIGGFNEWGGDVAMTDADGDGVYEAEVTVVGDYDFKVRADGAWDLSWGVYEADYDRTQNSQTNAHATVAEGQKLVVKLDTTKVDDAAKANADSFVNNADFNFDADGIDFWALTFEVVDASVPTTGDNQVKPFKTLGVIGGFNEWGGDVAMTDDGNGVYVAEVTTVGEYDFKVRADGAWDYSWGIYESDYDRTQNSQTNAHATVAEGQKLVVKLDTTKVDDAAKANAGSHVNESDFDFATEGYDFWPLTFEVVSATDDTSKDESSKDESSKDESSKDESSKDESSKDESSKNDGPYTTVKTDYIFFDNSQTKWDAVYAYWWHPDYARTTDLEGNDWGCVKKTNDDGTEGYEPVKFPGTKMTQVPGTDIWQIRIPFGATKIIFGSGKSDEQIAAGEVGYQTEDLAFDQKADAGKIYTIDTTQEAKKGRGVEKTKFKYPAGEWKTYEGAEYVQETIGKKVDASDPASTASTASTASKAGTGTTTTTSTTSTTVDAPATGEIAMVAAFIAVATAALGAVVLAKKKRED